MTKSTDVCDVPGCNEDIVRDLTQAEKAHAIKRCHESGMDCFFAKLTLAIGSEAIDEIMDQVERGTGSTRDKFTALSYIIPHGWQAPALQGFGGVKLPHPIPYQGSKRKLAPSIARYLPPGIETLYEPFAGSAAMTIYAAYHGLASRFVIADSLAPMIDLLRAIVEEPNKAAHRYRNLWNGQTDRDGGYFNRVRDRYNEAKDHVDLLYLTCRCVKNAIRFNRAGRFTQSVDKRRLGMRPNKMQAAIFGAAAILRDRVEFRTGDWLETTADARAVDFIYMDPPYLGTSIGRDRRYHQQMMQDRLVAGLEALRQRRIPFALSYDGTTGGREYGPPLPEHLGLTRLMLDAGASSQATLNGRREQTVESLYLTPGLAPALPVVQRSADVSLYIGDDGPFCEDCYKEAGGEDAND